MATTKHRLALAIIDFLNTSLTDGTLSPEEKESVEVATSCISDAFQVDATDKAAMNKAIGGQSLFQIYNVYEKLKDTTSAASASSSNDATAAASSTPASEAQKKEAEAFKSQGNTAYASKDYRKAIDLYSQALALVPGNAIFLSNRAAAYSALDDHLSAQADAEAAVASDPTYTKAWSRLGLARWALGDATGTVEAYEKAIDYEGHGGSDAMRKGLETARRRVQEQAGGAADADDGLSAPRGAGAAGMPDLSGLASMLGGGGGGAGMPDLSQIMSNPMFASMAQNLMSNPDALAGLMNNPRLREMANQFGGGGGGGEPGGGGGMPDLSALMQDPAIAAMARNFMGGAGRGGGAGGNAPS